MTQYSWIRCGQKQYAGAMGGGGKQEGRLEVSLLPDTMAGMSVAPGDASASALLASYTVAQLEGCEPTQPPASTTVGPPNADFCCVCLEVSSHLSFCRNHQLNPIRVAHPPPAPPFKACTHTKLHKWPDIRCDIFLMVTH